jgi:hypothetical protein
LIEQLLHGLPHFKAARSETFELANQGFISDGFSTLARFFEYSFKATERLIERIFYLRADGASEWSACGSDRR